MHYSYTSIPTESVGDIHLLYMPEGVVACGFGDKKAFLEKNKAALLSHVTGLGVNTVTINPATKFQVVPAIAAVAWQESPYAQIIQDYFSQPSSSQSSQNIHTIPTIQKGTVLQEKVWQTLRLIPYGETISYKELAVKCGALRAVRAVASACAKNACMVIVPCHRIVSSSGTVGKYAYGVEMKKALLLLEKQNKNTDKKIITSSK